MTQTGPAAQEDVLLPQGWSETNQDSSLLFRLDGLELHLIPGSRFEAVADAVGTLRESTYRQQLSGSGSTRDLDGRDTAYDHLILLEAGSSALAGSARLQFIPQFTAAEDLPGSQQSYLEHVYPGIKAMLAGQTHHVEIGRVALARRFQRQPHSLMALFRGGLLIAARSGFSILHGLVSYNHFAHSDAVNTAFLTALMRPPYRRISPVLPPPRHPINEIQPNDSIHPIGNVQALEVAIREEHSDDFRLPVLLRQYFNLMEAKVCDLSLAKDFNQITEILMAADLSRLPKDRLSFFIDVDHQPVYQQFSWYRGE
ncbi:MULTISPECIES: GNAT family N-acyltransferase [unclassified Synechococcus]|uniref:GNAT family N-acyltransferase n=1 Tax=unclassified Synechococcus TaxID=2626047 RepID=UPI001CF91B80|nr:MULTISPECIES: GNAT family N-acyltransferase [unclassified Synechococcus]MCB4412455.1 GNAT family N-acetyltransferase [Synechococcus sp. MU1611]